MVDSAKPLGFVAALAFSARNYIKNNVATMAQINVADNIVSFGHMQ